MVSGGDTELNVGIESELSGFNVGVDARHSVVDAGSFCLPFFWSVG